MKGKLKMNEYEDVTELGWVEYEFATIECDYRIHPDAARAINRMFKRLYACIPST